MFMSSIRLFSSYTCGVGCGDWVIGSVGDIGDRLVVSLIVVVFIVATILFLMITTIIMVVRRSFIIPVT